MRRITSTPLLILASLLISGCAPAAERPETPGDPLRGNSAPAQAEEPERPPSPAAPDPGDEWTASVVSATHQVTGVATLTVARLARNEGFDRLVLEFGGDELPSYRVEYVDQPVIQCGSGDPIRLQGDGVLLVRMEPARAHDDEGRPTIAERITRPALPVVVESRIICDFEAHLDWALGVATPNRFRVLELAQPSRLVVDIRH
jgi:hypothetical protein